MIVRSLAQIVLVIISLGNAAAIKSPALDRWVNRFQASYATAQQAHVAVPLQPWVILMLSSVPYLFYYR